MNVASLILGTGVAAKSVPKFYFISMADKLAADFLLQHGLGRLLSPLRKAQVRRQDFSYFKENVVELQVIMPNLRDRMDFIQSMRNTVADKECQADFGELICSHEVRNYIRFHLSRMIESLMPLLFFRHLLTYANGMNLEENFLLYTIVMEAEKTTQPIAENI